MIGLTEQTGGASLYQLKITLKWSDPAIWRRAVVRPDMTPDRLHRVIQFAMPWTDCHMHQFIVGRTYYGKPDPGMAGFGHETLNEKQYSIADIAPAAKKKFIYEYDFGDSWEHEIVVEKIMPPDPAFRHPVCLAGEYACPSDDCGGIPGYYNLLETLADPKHPDHAHFKDWIGGGWDASRFDLDEANDDLKRLKA